METLICPALRGQADTNRRAQGLGVLADREVVVEVALAGDPHEHRPVHAAAGKDLDQRRAEFKARRDYFLPALNAMGLTVPVAPDGAFYAWADCTAACQKLGLKDSWDFAFAALEHAHVAITPGRDFGTDQTARFVRFSTANSMTELQTAIARLKAWLQP